MRWKMAKKILFFVMVFVVGSLVLSLFTPVLLGQEEGLFSDSFDETGLEAYEHSQDVIVSDGVLKIEPGNFIFRHGAWEHPSFLLKFKITQPSLLVVNYHASDQGAYFLHVFSNEEAKGITLVKDQGGQGDELGVATGLDFKNGDWNDLSVSFDGQQHKVALNGQSVIESADELPLGAGGLGLVVPGENKVEIDDFTLTAGTETVPQGPAEEIPEEERPAEEGMPEEERPHEEMEGEPAMEGTEAADGQTVTTTGDTGWKGFMEQLFVTGAQPLDFQTFLINLALSAVFAYILGLVYVYWGASLSNRRKFAANFIIITVTTTFIILVVRSSVALSLGLVGALSIVRFRAAIKEPEELAYLFLAIGLGIGLGDNQRLITTLAFAFAIAVLGLLKLFRRSRADANMHLNITTFPPSKISLTDVQDALKPYCPKIKLLRFDENDKLLEMSFLVEFRKLDDLGAAREALQKLSDKIDITFLDNKGVW
jgi:hypothetical protein